MPAEQSAIVHDDGIFTVTIGPSTTIPTATSSDGTSENVASNVPYLFLTFEFFLIKLESIPRLFHNSIVSLFIIASSYLILLVV